MKLSGDQKMMLGLGAVALLGLLAWWGVQQMSSSQVSETLDVTHRGIGVVLGIAIASVAFAFVVLSILIPVFIYGIYKDVRKMREIAERNQSRIEQMRVDFSQIRKRWEA